MTLLIDAGVLGSVTVGMLMNAHWRPPGVDLIVSTECYYWPSTVRNCSYLSPSQRTIEIISRTAKRAISQPQGCVALSRLYLGDNSVATTRLWRCYDDDPCL